MVVDLSFYRCVWSFYHCRCKLRNDFMYEIQDYCNHINVLSQDIHHSGTSNVLCNDIYISFIYLLRCRIHWQWMNITINNNCIWFHFRGKARWKHTGYMDLLMTKQCCIKNFCGTMIEINAITNISAVPLIYLWLDIKECWKHNLPFHAEHFYIFKNPSKTLLKLINQVCKKILRYNFTAIICSNAILRGILIPSKSKRTRQR